MTKQLNIRIPDELIAALRATTKKRGISQFVISALIAALGNDAPRDRLTELAEKVAELERNINKETK